MPKDLGTPHTLCAGKKNPNFCCLTMKKILECSNKHMVSRKAIGAVTVVRSQ